MPEAIRNRESQELKKNEIRYSVFEIPIKFARKQRNAIGTLNLGLAKNLHLKQIEQFPFSSNQNNE